MSWSLLEAIEIAAAPEELNDNPVLTSIDMVAAFPDPEDREKIYSHEWSDKLAHLIGVQIFTCRNCSARLRVREKGDVIFYLTPGIQQTRPISCDNAVVMDVIE